MGEAFVFLILAHDLWYDEQNQQKLFRVFLLTFCADFLLLLTVTSANIRFLITGTHRTKKKLGKKRNAKTYKNKQRK